MKIGFWNIRMKEMSTIVRDIVVEQEPEIMFLGEVHQEDLPKLIDVFAGTNYIYMETPGCDRIVVVARNDLQVDLLRQAHCYTMLRVKDGISSTSIVSLHLPSQLYESMESLKDNIRDVKGDIERSIGISTEMEIIVIGDFNANPFESPMIGFDGFCATNGRKSRTTVVHQGRERATYINPTWRLYSRDDYPGSLRHLRPSRTCYDVLEWHYLDQVLISHKFNNAIESDYISILEKTKNYCLLDLERGRVKYSDHLPLLYWYKRRERNGME